MLYVAFSGGKDSTAMALRLSELGEDFELLFTPTGNELPELNAHMSLIVKLTGKTMITPPNPTLFELIEKNKALPNWRMRWCTRQIKIEPCIAFLKKHPGSTLAVGLRADEEDREGIYGPYANYRYPLREWGWGLMEVLKYVQKQGIKVPKRTDCALCYGQRLSEWWQLWKFHPEEFNHGVELEEKYKHTFRSAQRDKWPAPLKGLAERFEAGEVPKGITYDGKDVQLDLFAEDCNVISPDMLPCRVCRL